MVYSIKNGKYLVVKESGVEKRRMNNMNQNNGMQKRMLIMTLDFLYFYSLWIFGFKTTKEAKAALVKQEQAQKAKCSTWS